MQQQTSLAERAKLVIEYSIELRAEFERERTRSRAERERARQVSSAIQVLGQDPIGLFALWHAIDLSDRCGSLQERTSILLLAEAFLRPKETSGTLLPDVTNLQPALIPRRPIPEPRFASSL